MFRRKTGSGKGVFLTGRRVLGNGYAVLLLFGRDLFPIFCPPVPRQGEESLGGEGVITMQTRVWVTAGQR